ncbi:hypothetical protein CTA2_10361 [Colletotrichum tanaceti]|uniref:Uncharacterized protein n=1 Tax=Colletotrichum tanaceti TaxID=1306861 RepID=A0A4U6X3U3_9PEZI|nr:hypothetical protein CTA2_10361 [Colletotrichum tanaceti]TKW50040.1 hypothetical protein CTA1_12917 [Colletotrichum tanaceti]
MKMPKKSLNRLASFTHGLSTKRQCRSAIQMQSGIEMAKPTIQAVRLDQPGCCRSWRMDPLLRVEAVADLAEVEDPAGVEPRLEAAPGHVLQGGDEGDGRDAVPEPLLGHVPHGDPVEVREAEGGAALAVDGPAAEPEGHEEHEPVGGGQGRPGAPAQGGQLRPQEVQVGEHHAGQEEGGLPVADVPLPAEDGADEPHARDGAEARKGDAAEEDEQRALVLGAEGPDLGHGGGREGADDDLDEVAPGLGEGLPDVALRRHDLDGLHGVEALQPLDQDEVGEDQDGHDGQEEAEGPAEQARGDGADGVVGAALVHPLEGPVGEGEAADDEEDGDGEAAGEDGADEGELDDGVVARGVPPPPVVGREVLVRVVLAGDDQGGDAAEAVEVRRRARFGYGAVVVLLLGVVRVGSAADRSRDEGGQKRPEGPPDQGTAAGGGGRRLFCFVSRPRRLAPILFVRQGGVRL